jgi:TetR/AcrR family transcriptional regulator
LTADTSQCGGSRARRRRKHARAEELRDAALALFVEKGFEATRTEEIAARAGISKGTLYLYYPNKEKLLEAAIDSTALEAFGKICREAKRDGSSTDVLRRVLADVWAHLQQEPVGSVLKLAFAEAQRFPEIMQVWLRGAVSPVRSLIAEEVLLGMDRGEFRKMDPDIVAHSLLLPMFMACLQRYVVVAGAPADRCLDSAFVPQHVELVLRGLRCQAAH